MVPADSPSAPNALDNRFNDAARQPGLLIVHGTKPAKSPTANTKLAANVHRRLVAVLKGNDLVRTEGP